MTDYRQSKKSVHTETMTIGLVGDVVNYDIPFIYFRAIKDILLLHDINLLYFTAKPIRSPYGYSSQSNILYDMISEQIIDGLIIESNILASYVSQKELIDLCHRYHPLPIVNIGASIEGIPGILNDNAHGMYEAVSHLIEVHGHKRIAYILGPEAHPDVQERYNAYLRALSDHGIIPDEKLVLPGDFRTPSGNHAVSLLIDERKLKPCRDFDACVCANDYMAFGVSSELHARGIRIPEDIAVVGFDDVYISRFYTPALSTVHQCFDVMGRKAAELLINRLNGENTPDVIKVPARYVQRQSCGCKHSGTIEPDQVLELPAEISMAISSNPPEFLQQMSNKILDSGLFREELLGWDQVLTLLHQHELWNWRVSEKGREKEFGRHAWSVIGGASYKQFENIISSRSILDTGTGLISTLEISELMDILVRELPEFGIKRCFLALYENPPFTDPRTFPQILPKLSRLILAFDENGRIDLTPDGIVFPTRDLIPVEFLKQQDRLRMVVDALYFQNEHVGFWLLDACTNNEKVYPILANQISSSLKSALLFKRVQTYTRDLAAANKKIQILNRQLKDENLRINTEMEVARHIQISLLPEEIKTIHPDFDITARMLTAAEVGGDYYDISLDREGALWLGIGDVSGHGVTSGLVMMMAQTIHTTITSTSSASARDIVAIVNDVLFKNITGRMGETLYMTFTTLKYLGQGRFEYAGLHLDLLIYRHGLGTCELIETQGNWLNVKPDIRESTKNAEFTLDTGDVLVLFTDGLTEVFNRKKELLDIHGFKNIVTAHGQKDVDTMQEAIFRDVIAWCNEEYSDDMSLVLARRIR